MSVPGIIVIGLVEGFLSLPILLAIAAIIGVPLLLVVLAFAPHRPLR